MSLGAVKKKKNKEKDRKRRRESQKVAKLKLQSKQGDQNAGASLSRGRQRLAGNHFTPADSSNRKLHLSQVPLPGSTTDIRKGPYRVNAKGGGGAPTLSLIISKSHVLDVLCSDKVTKLRLSTSLRMKPHNLKPSKQQHRCYFKTVTVCGSYLQQQPGLVPGL